MAELKTNYVDDVLDSSKNQLRKYQQIQNDDGTVSFVDVTEYSTTGTSFGAKDINDTNAAVNELNNSLEEHTGVVEGSFLGNYTLIKKNNRVVFTGTIWDVTTTSPMIIPDGFCPTKENDVCIFCDGFNGTWGHVGSLGISKDGTTTINTPIGIHPTYYYKFSGSWDV